MRAAGTAPYFVALSPTGTDQLIAELGAANTRGIQMSQVIPHPWGEKLEACEATGAPCPRIPAMATTAGGLAERQAAGLGHRARRPAGR
jgi:hypothetical protein